MSTKPMTGAEMHRALEQLGRFGEALQAAGAVAASLENIEAVRSEAAKAVAEARAEHAEVRKMIDSDTKQLTGLRASQRALEQRLAELKADVDTAEREAAAKRKTLADELAAIEQRIEEARTTLRALAANV